MVAIDDIRDGDSFRAWLEETGQPQEVCVALAARAALRVLPLVWEMAGGDRRSIVPLLRANLVASIAGLAPRVLLPDTGHRSTLLRVAAAAAANVAAAAPAAAADAAAANAAAANAAAATTAPAAASAAVAAVTSAVAATAWGVVRSDCTAVERGKHLSSLPLFNGTPPHWYLRSVDHLPIDDEWTFWLNWLAKSREGQPQNWEMLIEIATIPDIDWRGHDPTIHVQIAEIAERYGDELTNSALSTAAEVYPLGETVSKDDADRYIVIPDDNIPDDAFALAKDRARHTITDMREEIGQSNNLRRMEKAARDVERELDRSPFTSVYIYEALSRAVVYLQILRLHDDAIKDDPLAKAVVQQFHDRFLESAVELCAHDPSVRANHDAKETLKSKDFPVPPTDEEKLRAIGKFYEDRGAGVLAEQAPEDAETAIDPDEPQEVRKSALLRLGGRVVRTIIYDRRVHGAGAAASLVGFAQANGLFDAVLALVRMFL